MADTNITADPILIVTSQGGVIGECVIAGPINIIFLQIGSIVQWDVTVRNPLLDITFDCSEKDRFNTKNAGVAKLEVEIFGTWLNETIFAEPIEILLTQHGSSPTGILVVSSPIEIAITIPDWDTV